MLATTAEAMSTDEARRGTALADETRRGEALADEALADEALADEALADGALADGALADEALADEALADEARRGAAFADQALADEAWRGTALAEETRRGAALADETLAEEARRGRPVAFSILVERYQDRIYRLAMRMSHNASDAEEIAQETFLHAHRGMRAFQGDSQFATWLYRIAMNEALMRRRSAKRRPTESLDAVWPGFADSGLQAGACPERADDLVENKALVLCVRRALDQLSDEHRSALVLRDLEELSAEDAAKILGVSADTVRQRAHRARLKLREMLADLLGDGA
ncbi:MAG: sigma-70 family RNA polymerase sigma factor [Polyangiaceae bacterium]|jgi:RNA polymerase sigma-70 factor (ECF subfamily)